MRDALLLLVRVFAGGVLVVAFAMLADMLKPKMFAGLLSGAPSVATVSLLLTGLQKPREVPISGRGMILGAAGLVACCVAASLLVPKLHAMAATAVGWVSWGIVTFALFLLLPR